MARLCGRLRFAAAFGVLLAVTATQASAGSIEMILTVSAGPTIIIAKGGPLDTSDLANPNAITVNTGALDTLLLGTGLTFSSLGASSNNPGAATATLTQAGQATTTGPAVSFTVTTVQLDYNSPVGAMGSMESSASSTLTNTTAGDSTAFQSFYDGTNTGALTTGSPILTLVSSGPAAQGAAGNAALTPLTPFVTPFALANVITVSLAANTHSPQDGFSGTTSVSSTAIPEPSSLALLGIGMTGFLAFRRLFKRPSVA
jgi:hypothetical protein